MGVLPTDVTEREQVEATVEIFGGLDVLVNNAGVGGIDPIEEASIEDYRHLMDVNVDGMYYAVRAAILPSGRPMGT
jgi:NADP-dependent 3-hydroxy acid dehydrogenase YdfG